ncbi:MAG: efflux RND transporter periplasmic adaptor subunit [Leptospiraceae bacterium]|nr:efflux RND transporter periplasmic adaptor subunit [Leptospiraceae bacterium]
MIKKIYEFISKIPYLSKLTFSALIYVAITILYSNLSWESFRNKVPLLTNIFYNERFKLGQIAEAFSNKEVAKDEEFYNVQVTKIELQNITPSLNFSAIIEPEEKVEIFSKVSGRIELIFVKEGDKVSKNQKLIKLDSLTFELDLQKQKASSESLLAQVNLAKEKLANSKRNFEVRFNEIEKRELSLIKAKEEYDRYSIFYKKKQDLFDKGITPLEELENIKLELSNKEKNYIVAENELNNSTIGLRDEDIKNSGYKIPKNEKDRKQILIDINTKLEKSEVELSKKNYEAALVGLKSIEMLIKESTLISPIDGTISKIFKYRGELINAGGSGNQSIMTIISLDKLLASFFVNESEISKFKIGQKSIIKIDSNQDEIYEGKIIRISPTVDDKTHSSEIKVEISGSKKSLKPGMFARASVEVGKNEKAILIPNNIILPIDEKEGYVYLYKSGKAYKTKVLLGESYLDNIKIIDGLVEGDYVITNPINKMRDGISVAIENK